MIKTVELKNRKLELGSGITVLSGFPNTGKSAFLKAIKAHSQNILTSEFPENHLHPRQQTGVGRRFAVTASQGIQVVVETNSEHVFNGIRTSVRGGIVKPEAVCFQFFQEDGNIISLKIDSNGRMDSWPDGFFDEWDKSLESLLV